jgi:hypothetical protein
MTVKSAKKHDKVSENVEEIVHDWEKDGTIGNSRPTTKKKAVKQAVAISLKKAGKSKYQK